MNEQIEILNYSFGFVGWIGIFVLALCVVVAISIISEVIRVEYRVWKVRRKSKRYNR